jgi:acyl-CoA synthetase (AMP-forming)/AMP-acid ligase II
LFQKGSMTSFHRDRLSTWSGNGLFWILRRGYDAHPGKVYLYGCGGRITYEQMYRTSLVMAEGVRVRCASTESPVVLASVRKTESLLYLVWACVGSGICLALVSELTDGSVLGALAKTVGASLLATDVSVRTPGVPVLNVDELINESIDRPVRQSGGAVPTPDCPAFVLQTSGTSGESKWVRISHGQFLTAVQCLLEAGRTGYLPGQVVYLTVPLYHSYGLSSLLEYTLAGSSIAVPSGSSALGPVGELTRLDREETITAIEGVPWFYRQLIGLRSKLRLPLLAHAGFGGEAVDEELIGRLGDVFPGISFSSRYGMTETPSVISHAFARSSDVDELNRGGRIMPIYEVVVTDDHGNPVPEGNEGEVRIRGKCVAYPYFPEDHDDSLFFRTGDMGHLRDGKLVVVGRRSAFLKHRGHRISPESVESAVRQFPGIDDCRAITSGGALIVEVVMRARSLSLKDLRSYLQGKVPDFSLPERIVICERIPRTVSGKISRFGCSQ